MSQYLRKIIQEVLQQLDDNNLIVKAGTELFHGTIEEFDKNNVRPGGYDGIFWTADSSLIAQTYISTSGKLWTSSEGIVRPSPDADTQSLQRQLGINYDYSQAEFNGQRTSSYQECPEFKEIEDHYYNVLDKYMAADKALKEFVYKFKKLPDDQQTDEMLNHMQNLEVEAERLKKMYYDFKPEKIKNEYVNKQLEKLGYAHTGIESYNSNANWKLKIDDNEIKPADYMAPGRLFIVVPKRDLKIYDTTWGGKRDGDLTDLDYHKHDWFEKAKAAGYDGIRITDFAQSEDEGNLGHLSIGLFRPTLKDVTITEIPATHQLIGNEYRGKDWHSPEYKNFKKQNP